MDDRLEGAGLENGLWVGPEKEIFKYSHFFPSFLWFYNAKYFAINTNTKSDFIFVKRHNTQHNKGRDRADQHP